jgi:hypothetical protein
MPSLEEIERFSLTVNRELHPQPSADKTYAHRNEPANPP